jgi:acetyl esterase/lipase
MHRILVCLWFLAFSSAALAAATVTNSIVYVTRPSGPLQLDASIPDGPGPFATVIIVHGGGFSGATR